MGRNSYLIVSDNTSLERIPGALISTHTIFIFQWVHFGILSQAVDLFGICTNMVNIGCFLKQGFNDPVNISLFGLAISDLFCVATLTWTNLCYTPAFSAADLSFDPAGVQYLVSAIPHVTFARVTAWITAFITLERCLCITAPLKVKQIFTTKRVAIIIVCIYSVLLFSIAPIYVVSKFGSVFDHVRNKTVFSVVFTEDQQAVEEVSKAINNGLIPAVSFIVIIVCTVVLAVKLYSSTKWRQQSTKLGLADSVSKRNQTVAKMVLMISTLFLACFIPISLIFVASIIEPGLAFDGKYRNLLIVVAGLGLFLESVNSSGNIFIYYKMSSKYRETLNEMFHIKTANTP